MKILIKNITIQPSASEPAIIDANIGIVDDTITFMGEIPVDFTPDKTINGTNKLAIPGLVNAHSHTAMTLFRGYADDMSLETWLFDKILPVEETLTDDDVYWGAMLGIAEMIRGGITCFNDMYHNLDSTTQAVKDSGIRAVISIGSTLDSDASKAFYEKWDGASNGRLRTNLEVHSLYIYDSETLVKRAKLAKEIGIPVHMHLSETATERQDIIKKYGKSPIQLAEEYGLFDGSVMAAHCVHIDDNDIAILKSKGVNVVHNPSSNLKLASGVAPIPKMLSEGVNVCLGTDGAASNNDLNMFQEMHLAALLHKGVNSNPTTITAVEAFQMATENGAKALGFTDCGVIAVGKKADIAILSLDSPHLTPIFDHVSTLAYSAQGSDVETVIVNGQILMENRQLLTIDEEKTKRMVREIAKKFK